MSTRIKLIIFDLDGVLVDACEWHYISLNKTLIPFYVSKMWGIGTPEDLNNFLRFREK